MAGETDVVVPASEPRDITDHKDEIPEDDTPPTQDDMAANPQLLEDASSPDDAIPQAESDTEAVEANDTAKSGDILLEEEASTQPKDVVNAPDTEVLAHAEEETKVLEEPTDDTESEVEQDIPVAIPEDTPVPAEDIIDTNDVQVLGDENARDAPDSEDRVVADELEAAVLGVDLHDTPRDLADAKTDSDGQAATAALAEPVDLAVVEDAAASQHVEDITLPGDEPALGDKSGEVDSLAPREAESADPLDLASPESDVLAAVPRLDDVLPGG